MITLDNKVKEINEKVFNFLLDWHFKEKQQGNDFFFMMNENRDQLFRYKEPFKYYKKHIILSFWQNYHSTNLYNLKFEIEIDSNVRFIAEIDKLITKKEEFISLFLNDEVVASIDENRIIIQFDSSPTIDSIISHLKSFLINQKRKIDNWILGQISLEQQPLSNSEYFKENSFFAMMIRPEHFTEMLFNTLNSLVLHQFKYFNSKKQSTKPIKHSLIGFQIRNYKGIINTTISNLPVDANWIIITGKNGFGKTSLLQALTISKWGKRDADINLISANEDPFILVDWHVNNENWRQYVNKYTPTDYSFAQIVAYGSSRLQNQATIPTDKDRLRDGSVISLFDNRRDLLNIESELITSYKYNKTYFDKLVSVFYKLIPNLHEIQINESSTPFVQYIEKDDNENIYKSVKLNELASGFRNIISFVGDMVLRLSETYNNTIENLEEMTGIVIIDEIDLHLHPIYQKQLPKLLTEIFPRIQFIASTHSPIPLLGVPKETIILNVDRTEEHGIIVKRLDEEIDFQNLSPEDILSSPIFGFDDFIPEANENLEDINTEENPSEAKHISGLKKKLKILKANLNVN